MILNEVSKIIVPLTQIFSIYIIFHGHLSPGGGFAGGTILGASFILKDLAFEGKNPFDKNAGYIKLLKPMCIALIFYGVLKGYSFISGGSHLELFNIPLGTPGKILSGGMLLPLNIAVGMVVAMTMYLFFLLFYEGEG